MKPWLLALGAALAVALSLGCRPPTRVEVGNERQILHLSNGAEPADLDPQIVTGVPEHQIIMSLLEGLVSEDPRDLHPVPGVAERWEVSPNGEVYTFDLREDALWSNGEPVTARDFALSYERMLNPALAAEYSYMLYPILNAEAYNKGEISDFSKVGVKALSPRKLEITLRNATPYFLSLLNHNSFFPVPIETIKKQGGLYDRRNRWTRPESFVGNGPFDLKEWKVNDVIAVEKSATYWDRERVRLQEIRFYPIESYETEERAFRARQLHKTHEIPLSKIAVYRERAPDLLQITPWLGVYFYMFNVERPGLDDPRVRRALSLAIDREALVTHVTRGGQLPAHHFTPPETAGYQAEARVPTDIEEAKRLLAEAGYPNGEGFPSFNILYNTAETHRTIAEAIQQMWKKGLNIDVGLENQEWKVFLDSQNQRNYDISRFGWIGDYVDPTGFLDLWVTGGGNNRAGWSNPEYDRLIRQAGRTGNTEERFELFQKAEAILLAESPVAPIYFYTRVYLLNPSVKGWHPTILDHHPYKYVYLDPAGADAMSELDLE